MKAERRRILWGLLLRFLIATVALSDSVTSRLFQSSAAQRVVGNNGDHGSSKNSILTSERQLRSADDRSTLDGISRRRHLRGPSDFLLRVMVHYAADGNRRPVLQDLHVRPVVAHRRASLRVKYNENDADLPTSNDDAACSSSVDAPHESPRPRPVFNPTGW